MQQPSYFHRPVTTTGHRPPSARRSVMVYQHRRYYRELVLPLGALLLLRLAVVASNDSSRRHSDETTTADRFFPAFHARFHAGHNNDPNGPLKYNGVYHLFLQQTFPWDADWNGGIGWGHLDQVHVKPLQGGATYFLRGGEPC